MQSRLAKFNCRLSEDDARALMVLLRAQGYKLTARDPDNEMLEVANGVRFAAVEEGKPASTFQSAEAVWRAMWEVA